MFKAYSTLTKSGIILFSLVCALAGYAMSLELGRKVDFAEIALLMVGLYLSCAGSFVLNQVQEWKIDKLMDRTKGRPIPQGLIAPWQGIVLAIIFLVSGFLALLLLNTLCCLLTILTVVLYNGFYTLYWKRKWVFGAVPGALPGAMPVVIGYSVNSQHIFSPECLYLFLILFLWQMPHFWCLAIRYAEDYGRGGFPVMPLKLGVDKALYHIGLYVFVYVGVAMLSPWFLKANVLYLLLVFPLCLKMLYEFWIYFKSHGQQRWLSFFLWTNLSMLVFLGVPVFDRWFFYLWA